MPHMKSYLRYLLQPDNSAELPWALVTSHNLSKAAWGQLQVLVHVINANHSALPCARREVNVRSRVLCEPASDLVICSRAFCQWGSCPAHPSLR